MGFINDKKAKKDLTDAEKNDRAADQIKSILRRAASVNRRMVKNLNRIVKNAPATKANLLKKLGTDEAEAVQMINKMKDFANAHKKEGDPDLTF